jgi:hypothetical protein
MSTTIGNLVDRVFREYLEPADSLESYSYLTGGISNSSTTIGYANDMFSVEEEDALDAGTIIEIGQELMFSTALNTVTNEITVVRGARGTTAAAHSAGDLIKVSPTFSRKAVFDAVSDQIENLYPTLFAVETKSITAKTGINVLSGATDNYLIAPVKAISQYTDFDAGQDSTISQFRGVSVELVDLPNPFTYTDSEGAEQTVTYTSGPNKVNAMQSYGITAGKTIYVSFKKKFVTVTSESDTLASIGLENEYEPIVMAGVAAQLIAGKDVPSLTANYITQQIQVQNVPIGSSNSIRNSLLQYQQLLIQQARKDLRARFPEPVSFNSITYPSV